MTKTKIKEDINKTKQTMTSLLQRRDQNNYKASKLRADMQSLDQENANITLKYKELEGYVGGLEKCLKDYLKPSGDISSDKKKK